ncbi:unnamed protein product [Urochloa decumbens]|uniref:Uncharacterized protein n=1 Tax=Urochloa decumbens TaxID=240449 RepID=A0ABC9AQN6_9POAL
MLCFLLSSVPGPFQSAVPVATGDMLPSLIRAATGNLSLYEKVLSSRDGFLLLDGQETDNLCLCNPMTRHCTFLPEVDQLVPDTYVLITGYDDGCSDLGVRIAAVKGEEVVNGFMGPLKRSPEFTKCLVEQWIWPQTEFENDQLILATSGDGRLSLIRKPYMQTWVQVWVLVGADQWTMQHFIDAPILRSLSHALSPRSGFLHVEVDEEEGQVQELLIDVENGSSRSIRCLNPDDPTNNGWRCPYEMDWWTYLSKLKPF